MDLRDYRYLGYYWDSFYYFDTVLVMGQPSAAMACQRTTNGVMYIHNERGHHGLPYLDDLIGVASPEDADIAYQALIFHVIIFRLTLCPSVDLGSLVPTQSSHCGEFARNNLSSDIVSECGSKQSSTHTNNSSHCGNLSYPDPVSELNSCLRQASPITWAADDLYFRF